MICPPFIFYLLPADAAKAPIAIVIKSTIITKREKKNIAFAQRISPAAPRTKNPFMHNESQVTLSSKAIARYARPVYPKTVKSGATSANARI